MGKASTPLKGKNILVTRGEKQAGKLSEKLEEQGARAIEIPVLHFGEPDSWEPLDAALASLDSYDWIIFASTNAVDAVLSRCTTLGINLKDAEQLKIAAIGSSTERELAGSGLTTHFRPSSFVAEKFIEEFLFDRSDLTGIRMLWPRTNIGRTDIADRLRARGAVVDTCEAYSTGLPPDSARIADNLVQTLSQRAIDAVTLASAQTAKNFAALIESGCRGTGQTVGALLENVVIASIGPVTSDAARERLGRIDIEAGVFTTDGLVAALIEYYCRD